MEAKRYKGTLSLEGLVAKAVVGAHALGGAIDLWVLGATSAAGDDALKWLTDILEREGVSFLALDWSDTEIPQLALLLAWQRDATLDWFRRSVSDAPLDDVARELDEVRRAEGFDRGVRELRVAVNSADLGLDALRGRSRAWMATRLADRGASRRSFGQFVVPLDSKAPTVRRAELVGEVSRCVREGVRESTVVAVLGDEGTGKTWLVAQACSELAEKPIFVLVAGRRCKMLKAEDPRASLSSLLTEQGGADPGRVKIWHRRLTRWSNQGKLGQLRFVVVLDGLDERPSLPWTDLLQSLAEEVSKLGGCVVVTSRPAFWDREIVPRLGQSSRVQQLRVEQFTNEELDEVLARAGLGENEWPAEVRSFVRNPRACAVALRLLDRLSLQPSALTIERLLLEYWRARLEERGDLVAHSVEEFHELLIGHARDWRERPDRTYRREKWQSYSPAAEIGLRPVAEEIAEIEEGRFMTVTSSGRYTFRAETVPFAMALLLVAEVQSALDVGKTDMVELVGRQVEEIRGFDRVSDILAAAVLVARGDPDLPRELHSAIVAAWLGLQNVSAESIHAMSAYAVEAAAPMLDAAELPESQGGRGIREDLLLPLLLDLRNGVGSGEELQRRVNSWLGYWSRSARRHPGRTADEHERRQADRLAKVERGLAEVGDWDGDADGWIGRELDEPPAISLGWLTARALAGAELATYSKGLLCWCLARVVAFDFPDARADLAWLLRMNGVDFEETRQAIVEAVGSVTVDAPESVRRSAAVALDLLGDVESARRAHLLAPVSPGRRLRSVERYCETNPHDVSAGRGANISHALDALPNVDLKHVWTRMGDTTEDLQLEEMTPALARFAHKPLVEVLRSLVDTATSRSGLPLRQLAWRLPALSPLFNAAQIASVEASFRRTLQKPEVLPGDDADWIRAKILRAILSRSSGEKQLTLLQQLPENTPTYGFLVDVLSSVSSQHIDAELLRVSAAEDPAPLRWTLSFLAWSSTPLSSQARNLVLEQLSSGSAGVRDAAASAVFSRAIRELDAEFIDRSVSDARVLDADAEFCLARAFAAAVSRDERDGPVPMVAATFRQLIVEQQPTDERASLFLNVIEEAIRRLLLPISSIAPTGATVTIALETTTADRRTSIAEFVATDIDSRVQRMISELNDPEAAACRLQSRQEELAAEWKEFVASLRLEGAEALVDVLSIGAARKLVSRDPKRVLRWLELVRRTTDPGLLAQVSNLAVVLAAACASHDALAASLLLRHIRDAEPVVRVVTGRGRVWLFAVALFSAPDAAQLDALREEEFAAAGTDADLEELTKCAELTGASGWLDRYVNACMARAVPGEIARGISVAGLRSRNRCSDEVLARDWGVGFLGDAHKAAKKNYDRNAWARHWHDEALSSSDLIDYWRFAELSIGIADWRYLVWSGVGDVRPQLAGFAGSLEERYRNAARRRRSRRERTLFGVSAPSRDLWRLLTGADAR